MRIAYLSDIHTDHQENFLFLHAVISAISQKSPDILVVAGDISHHVPRLEKTLEMFESVSCPKVFVPGNHDIWCRGAEDSFEKHNHLLPMIFKNHGWHWLPGNPYIHDTIAFVGTLGWYDYSFQVKEANYTLEQYQKKSANGLVWMDSQYAKWVLSETVWTDEQVLTWLLDLAEKDLYSIPDYASIIFITHHVPFDALMFRGFPISKWSFFRAYMGSERIGQLILRHPKIAQVIFGHRHFESQSMIHGLSCVANPMGYPRERSGQALPSDYATILEWGDHD